MYNAADYYVARLGIDNAQYYTHRKGKGNLCRIKVDDGKQNGRYPDALQRRVY